MKPGELTARIVALGFATCAAFAFAAPASIGIVTPDEEPRYTNPLPGLRQGVLAAGAGSDNLTIVEHGASPGDSARALRAAES